MILGAKSMNCRVFNHYNRVRANLAATEDQPDEQRWDVVNISNGTFSQLG